MLGCLGRCHFDRVHANLGIFRRFIGAVDAREVSELARARLFVEPFHVARFGDFEFLRPCAAVDLLVCSDVLHYLPTRELDRGLPALAELCGGMAFLEAFAREDEAVGDEHGFIARPAAFYRKRLRALGLRPLGSHCWLSPARVDAAASLELPD